MAALSDDIDRCELCWRVLPVMRGCVDINRRELYYISEDVLLVLRRCLIGYKSYSEGVLLVLSRSERVCYWLLVVFRGCVIDYEMVCLTYLGTRYIDLRQPLITPILLIIIFLLVVIIVVVMMMTGLGPGTSGVGEAGRRLVVVVITAAAGSAGISLHESAAV